MTREGIYAALFELICQAPGLVMTSRKLLHWADVPAGQRPALFQAQGGETYSQTTGLPAKRFLSAKLYIYVSTVGAVSPGEVLNPILDAITAMFDNGQAGYRQTLGGLVHYARIEGTIETSEGTLGDDEVAIIPVQILTAT
jgi:hypothetical protein